MPPFTLYTSENEERSIIFYFIFCSILFLFLLSVGCFRVVLWCLYGGLDSSVGFLEKGWGECHRIIGGVRWRYFLVFYPPSFSAVRFG